MDLNRSRRTACPEQRSTAQARAGSHMGGTRAGSGVWSQQATRPLCLNASHGRTQLKAQEEHRPGSGTGDRTAQLRGHASCSAQVSGWQHQGQATDSCLRKEAQDRFRCGSTVGKG